MNKQTNKTNYEIDMCNGSILKKMFFFALPLMCSGILKLLFNAADIVVVGRFAGKRERISKILLRGLLCALVVGLLLGNTGVLLGKHLVGNHVPNGSVPHH